MLVSIYDPVDSKGGSAKVINDLMGRRGPVWASDYYDKEVRDEKHFAVVYRYIKDNPMKLRGMCDGRFFGFYED